MWTGTLGQGAAAPVAAALPPCSSSNRSALALRSPWHLHAAAGAGAPAPQRQHHLRRRRGAPLLLAARAAPEAAVAEPVARGKAKGGASGVGSGIKLENIAITFRNHQVLRDVSWDVKKGERVGLVGVNGAGKTTQLQIITGKLLPDAGEVVKAKANMKIAYLTQEFDVEPTRTVREEFVSAFHEAVKTMKRQEELQLALENCGEDMTLMSKLLDEMSLLQSRSEELDISLLDKQIDQMMPELGFKLEDSDRLVASFSGGWQMRMCLGKILLQEPDLLLLDEPTNHLDVDAIEWLEGYLKKQEIPMVIVSHDREFLDQLCTKVVETERGVAATYKGNYTDFVKQKEEKDAQQWVAYERQQKEMARQAEIVARLSAGARSGRASTADKALDKLKAEGTVVEKPFIAKKRPFTFPPVERMGITAVRVDGLTHGYNGRTLFKDADLVIERGERVAIIGPNGAGKSTLLRLLMDRETPQSGTVEMGPHGVVPNYFEQNQAEALDLNLTVMETLEKAAPDAKLNEIKGLAGKMLFSGTSMEKQVGVLSGGEKARLAMAKFMLTEGSLLVLDEPTNHLDIPSKETLEEAIRAFQGSVIAVSHDRYFLRRIATRIVTVENGKLVDYQGDYELFLEQNEEESEKMTEREEKQKEITQSHIKAQSKTSKAEKARQKKEKAKSFNTGGGGGGAPAVSKSAGKNAKRWN